MKQISVQIRYFLFFYLGIVTLCFSQNKKTDSLLKTLNTTIEDTNLVKKYLQIASGFLSNGNNLEVRKYASLAKDAALKINDQKNLANAYNFIGISYKEMGNYTYAMDNYLKSLTIAEKNNFIKLKLNLYENLGNIYADRGELDKALVYYNKSLKLSTDSKSKRVLQTYNSIAIIFAEKGDLQNALNCFQKVYDISKANHDPFNMEGPIGNIGNVYFLQNNYSKALQCFQEAYEISKFLGDKNKIALWLQNIGTLYVSTNALNKAEKYLKESLQLADSIGAFDLVKTNNQQLYLLNEKLNNYRLAIEYYQKFVAANDSINSSGNINKIVQLEMNYEFDSKEQEEKLVQEKKDAIASAEHKKNNYIIFIFSFVLVLLGLFASYIYKGNLNKQKANKELSAQKNIIEEKQNEIIASIHYAKRIQSALLTSENYIEKNLNRLTNKNG